MASPLTHFAINADDVDASRTFFEAVFGWTFNAYGPPDFFQIDTGGDGTVPMGALQSRRDLVEGRPTLGLECTFAVEDVDETYRRVVEAGGQILMERFTISRVGHLIAFADPSGNPILAMQYDTTAE